MVRDFSSLIEYLYLKSINSPLLGESIIVNPRSDDFVGGKICIINENYQTPDLSLAKKVINRNIDHYILKRNKLITPINMIGDLQFVCSYEGNCLLGELPETAKSNPVNDYVRWQLNHENLIAGVDEVLKPLSCKRNE